MRHLLKLTLALLSASAAVASAPAVDLPQMRRLADLVGVPELKTNGGEEIRVVSFEAKDENGEKIDPKFRFLVQGGIHGNEETASAFVAWLARRYAHGKSLLNQLPRDKVAVDFLPFANPDGSNSRSRANARGVNLNRNFGVLWGLTRENPGTTSFSEPETRAIRALFAKRKYAAAVDVHGYVNWVVAPTEPKELEARGIKVDPARAKEHALWQSALKAEMKLLRGYQLKTAGALGDGGAFEDWAFWSEGSLAYCLELESFERYVRPYRRDFNDLTAEPTVKSVDNFARYETFIYRAFEAALKIKERGGDTGSGDEVAGN